MVRWLDAYGLRMVVLIQYPKILKISENNLFWISLISETILSATLFDSSPFFTSEACHTYAIKFSSQTCLSLLKIKWMGLQQAYSESLCVASIPPLLKFGFEYPNFTWRSIFNVAATAWYSSTMWLEESMMDLLSLRTLDVLDIGKPLYFNYHE